MLIILNAFSFTAGSDTDKLDAIEGLADQLLFMVHNRHIALLFMCSYTAMIDNFEGIVCNN